MTWDIYRIIYPGGGRTIRNTRAFMCMWQTTDGWCLSYTTTCTCCSDRNWTQIYQCIHVTMSLTQQTISLRPHNLSNVTYILHQALCSRSCLKRFKLCALVCIHPRVYFSKQGFKFDLWISSDDEKIKNRFFRYYCFKFYCFFC